MRISDHWNVKSVITTLSKLDTFHRFMREETIFVWKRIRKNSNLKCVTTNYTTNIHVISVHEKKKLFKCEMRYISCSHQGNLRRHLHQFMARRNFEYEILIMITVPIKKVTWINMLHQFMRKISTYVKCLTTDVL